jgi:hypothetical protein
MTVPSSTSSFDGGPPPGPWGRVWLGALVLTGLTLGLYEACWRCRGVVPSVESGADLWGQVRSQVGGTDRDQVVFIGASRSLCGINTAAFAAAFHGQRPLMLSVAGSCCLPVLQDLSQDESFCGILVCDPFPDFLTRPISAPEERQAEYLRKYRARSAAAPLEMTFQLQVRQHLVFRRPELRFPSLLGPLLRGGLPESLYLETLPDRSVHMDFHKPGAPSLSSDPADFWQKRSQSRVTPGCNHENLERIEGMVSRIQGRGGRVVFVRFPCSGPVLAEEERFFPRKEHWDVLAAQTGARTIHFADYSELSCFTCPDGSHLDYRDAIPFSRALARLLRAEGARRADLQANK